MTTYRVMSYHINGLLGGSGKLIPELSSRIIQDQDPDLVFLQGLGTAYGNSSVKHLARLTGLDHYGPDSEGSCCFLSRYPLHNLQTFPLGYGGRCLRADFDHGDQRLHLFNVSLGIDIWQRYEQVRILLSELLLNNSSYPCGTIIAGDFGLPLWDCGQLYSCRHQLRRIGRPLCRANFPAKFPLWGRDRIYLRGPLQEVSAKVLKTTRARLASPHLPIMLTLNVLDNRTYLTIKKQTPLTAKQADPLCG